MRQVPVVSPRGGISLGVVGKDNHAARLIQCMERLPEVESITIYYHRAYEGKDERVTQDWEKLVACDGVVIASPTFTHYEYLDRLSRYAGYILVEKPAVATFEESKLLENWPESRKSKLKVNYNFLESPVFDSMQKLVESRSMGEPIAMDIRMCHGFAFTEKYATNWRSGAASLGVAELLGVHFINAAMHLFGDIRAWNVKNATFAEQGNSADTASITLDMDGDIRTNILVSYAMPYTFQIQLFCTNGIYSFDGIEEAYYAPRDSFDNAGRFSSPPKASSRPISYRENWDRGLESAMGTFVNTINRRERFDPRFVEKALRTIEPLLDRRIV